MENNNFTQNYRKQKRWEIAQAHEKDYWGYVKSNITKEDNEQIKKYWNQYLEVINKHIIINQNSKILEIGSGPEGIINYISNGEKYALDPLMDYYRENFKLSEDVRWSKGVGEKMPFENNYFDVVISTNTLDHTSNPQKVIDEIKRVLKNNGFLFLTVDCHQPFSKKYRKMKEFFKKGDKLHPYSFSIKDVVGLIKKAELTSIFIQQGIGDLGRYTINESQASRPIFFERVHQLYKEKGIIALLDASINKALISLERKIIGIGDKIDFIFIAKK